MMAVVGAISVEGEDFAVAVLQLNVQGTAFWVPRESRTFAANLSVR